jgi:hypothetical protein
MHSKFGLRSVLSLAATAWLACAAAPAWSQHVWPTYPDPSQKATAIAWARAAGVGCDIRGVDFAGSVKTDTLDAEGKPIWTQAYEVSCRGRFGYAVMSLQGTQLATPCPAVNRTSRPTGADVERWSKCNFVGDRDGLPVIRALTAARGSDCVVAAARWRGVDTAKKDLFELTCKSPSPGYVLAVSRVDGSTDLIGCLNPSLDFACALATDAERKAWLGRLVDQAGRRCGEARTRFAAASSESEVYEVRCSADGGFMVEADLGGGFRRAIECKDAAAIGGGCVLKP